MINLDEDALICDLAETYHIFNYRELPSKTVGALACGLKETSRIKMKLSGIDRSLDTLILAVIADRLGMLICQHSPKATASDIPPSIYKKLINQEDEDTNNNNMTFTSGADFEKYRSSLLGKINGQ